MMLRPKITYVLMAFFTVSCVMQPIPATAAPLLQLPEPGRMVELSPAFKPMIIQGVTVHQDNPFLFDFIVDPGQQHLNSAQLKEEGQRLIKYFMAALTVPAKDLWVNLSPYEKDRVVNEALGQTDLGRDMLAQDYLLKQLTASLIYPEKQLGKTFWEKVYAKAREVLGSSEVRVNTFNKVWIMADKPEVYQHGQTAYVTKNHLKVMLEQDYVAAQLHHRPERSSYSEDKRNSSATGPAHAQIGTQQVVRDVVLPEIEREINEGKNFAAIRQIFNAIILAGWYKKTLKDSLLTKAYADKKTIRGIDLADKTLKEQIFQRYVQAYKKGVFNYVKEEPALAKVPMGGDLEIFKQTVPRKYFSGGVDGAMAADPAVVSILPPSQGIGQIPALTILKAELRNKANKGEKVSDPAMPSGASALARNVTEVIGTGMVVNFPIVRVGQIAVDKELQISGRDPTEVLSIHQLRTTLLKDVPDLNAHYLMNVQVEEVPISVEMQELFGISVSGREGGEADPVEPEPLDVPSIDAGEGLNFKLAFALVTNAKYRGIGFSELEISQLQQKINDFFRGAWVHNNGQEKELVRKVLDDFEMWRGKALLLLLYLLFAENPQEVDALSAVIRTDFLENKISEDERFATEDVKKRSVLLKKLIQLVHLRALEVLGLEAVNVEPPITVNEAMSADTTGGIDLKNAQQDTIVTKEGESVQMKLDPAMVKTIRREGIGSLSPFIYDVAALSPGNFNALLGLKPPPQSSKSQTARW